MAGLRIGYRKPARLNTKVLRPNLWWSIHAYKLPPKSIGKFQQSQALCAVPTITLRTVEGCCSIGGVTDLKKTSRAKKTKQTSCMKGANFAWSSVAFHEKGDMLMNPVPKESIIHLTEDRSLTGFQIDTVIPPCMFSTLS